MKRTLSWCACVASAVIMTAVIVSMAGCGPALPLGDAIYQEAMQGKGCLPTSAMCDGNRLMLCNADHKWEENTNCEHYETPRECCTIGDQTGCFRARDCKEVSDVE